MVAHHSIHSSIHPSSSRALTTLAPGWTPLVKPGTAPRCILGCRLCDSRYRDIKYPHHLYFNLSIYCQSISTNPTSLPLAIVPGCYLAFDLPVRYPPGPLPSQPYRLLLAKVEAVNIFFPAIVFYLQDRETCRHGFCWIRYRRGKGRRKYGGKGPRDPDRSDSFRGGNNTSL